MLAAMTACSRRTVYNSYEHTPLSGWEKNDTLIFDISPVSQAGKYYEEVGLRINTLYPFMGLSLVIDQTIYPLAYTHRDTLNCSLIDENATVKGKGVSYYQYNFHLTDVDLNKGDSMHICVRHNMKREILRGIADVGIMLRRKIP